MDAQKAKIEALEAKNDALDTGLKKLDAKIEKLEKSLTSNLAKMNEDIVTKVFMGLENFKKEINNNMQNRLENN